MPSRGRIPGELLVLLVGLLGVLCAAPVLRADALDDIKSRGVLIWGADQEGGGPYVYPDAADPSKLVGFEVDLARALAAELGVKAQFFQGDWDKLPQFLNNRTIDIILNGYEWTPDRAAQMLATRPYYIYELQLLTREDDTGVRGWDDLSRRNGQARRQVSVLGGSGAATYLHERWGEQVDIVEYDGNTNAMAKVRDHTHDATLQDLPIAIFYRTLPQGQGLRFADRPVGRGYYVMYTRPGEQRLVNALNQAIEKLFHNGRLEAIYDTYGLWNVTQERLLEAQPGQASAEAPRGWSVVTRYGSTLVKAAGMTVFLSCAAMPIAILLGLFVAMGRLYGGSLLRVPLGAYVEILRGTPVMLQLYVIYFLLPQISPIALSPLVAAIAGLAINYSAYEAEIYRAGLQAIPIGQMEAALALGMTRWTALRRVIVPQAVRIVVPPVTNDFIALFKDTSICSVIAITELTKQYNILANSTGAILELAAMTGILYMVMSYPLSLAARRMEAKMAAGERKAAM